MFLVIPVRGPPALIAWTGPHLLPRIFNGDPSGVWVGWGPERGQGQGMPKKTPRPRPLSGAGRGKGQGARVLRGPVRPVMNSRCKEIEVVDWVDKTGSDWQMVKFVQWQ